MPRCKHAATSVWSAAFEQMAVAVLGHPAGTREVAFPGTTRTLRFSHGINVQNDSCDVLPIRSVGFGVEQAKVRNRMSLVLAGEDGRGWSDVVHWGIEWRRLHDGSSEGKELRFDRFQAR
jgi:hypothetical protein